MPINGIRSSAPARGIWRAKSHLALLALLFLGLIQSVRSVVTEWRVWQAWGLADAASDGAPAGSALPPFRATTDPRLGLYDALARAHEASITAYPQRRALMIDQARRSLQPALTNRPGWGAAWIARTYVALLEEERPGPATREALSRSYQVGPYSRDAASWRIRLAIEQWAMLDDATRSRVIDEAVWLSRLGSSLRIHVYVLMGGTPAYPEYEARRFAVFGRRPTMS